MPLFFVIMIKTLRTLILFVLTGIPMLVMAEMGQKPAFSSSGLQYLLNRREYDRFDWYINRFMERYPDTAVLHLLKGHRYFYEASESRLHTVSYSKDRTGGRGSL